MSCRTSLMYYAYDRYIENEYKVKLLEPNIIPCLREIINDEKDLKEMKFDIILLFNMMHEMDINNWKNEINILLDVLKDDGYLVFCERRILSRGEKPYGESGFLVLSENELKKLFSSMDVIIKPCGSDIKLVTAVIEKKKEPGNHNITIGNISKALEELITNMEGKIFPGSEKKEGKLYSRDYAFYCQQYLNAIYALKLLKEKKDTPDDFKKWNFARIMSEKDKERRYFYLTERSTLCDDDIAEDCKKEIKNRR